MSLHLTYLNNFRGLESINNPVIGSAVQMRFNGFFSPDYSGRSFNSIGFGLKKTINSKGRIYCDDASELFDIEGGSLNIVLSFPYDITNGIYAPLQDSTTTFNEYILWGVNIGQREASQPSLYAALTKTGIQFSIWTYSGRTTIVDSTTTVSANTDILFEFIWDSNGIIDFPGNNFGIKVDSVYTAYGLRQGLVDENITNLTFNLLNTPYLYSNMECTIRWMSAFSDDMESSSSSE